MESPGCWGGKFLKMFLNLASDSDQDFIDLIWDLWISSLMDTKNPSWTFHWYVFRPWVQHLSVWEFHSRAFVLLQTGFIWKWSWTSEETVGTLLLSNWGLHESVPALWDTEPCHQDTASLDSQRPQDQSSQCAQKMPFNQNISSHRLSAILLNVRTLNVSSSFCSLWASGLFSADLIQLFLLFTQLCNTLKEFPSQNHRQKKA